VHHYNIAALSHAQIWYAFKYTPKNSNIVTVEQKAKITYI